jgi:hypothetical protein
MAEGLLDWFGGLFGTNEAARTPPFVPGAPMPPTDYGIDPAELRKDRIRQGLLMAGAGLASGQNWGEGIGRGLLGYAQGRQQATEDAYQRGLLGMKYKEFERQQKQAEEAMKAEAEKQRRQAESQQRLYDLLGGRGSAAGALPVGTPTTSPTSYADTLAKYESSGGKNTVNPLNPNVSGPYQVDSRYWPQTAGMAPDQALGVVLQSNADAFNRATGRPPRDWEQYGMHRFGAAGFRKLMAAAPDAPTTAVFGETIVGDNPDLAGKTAGQVRAMLVQRFGGGSTWAGEQPTRQAAGPGPDFTDPRSVAALNMLAQDAGYSGTIFDTQPFMGTIPPGYQVQKGPDGSNTLIKIPGSPAAEAEIRKEEQKERTKNIVLDEIGRAKQLIINQDVPVTGTLGPVLAKVGGTDAKSLATLLTTIKANVGFDKLQQMRDASPTGAALGPVSDYENQLVQAVLGSLDQGLSEDDLLYNLDRLGVLVDDIVNKGIQSPAQRAPTAAPTQSAPTIMNFDENGNLVP